MIREDLDYTWREIIFSSERWVVGRPQKTNSKIYINIWLMNEGEVNLNTNG